jgi:hypothetical protein
MHQSEIDQIPVIIFRKPSSTGSFGSSHFRSQRPSIHIHAFIPPHSILQTGIQQPEPTTIESHSNHHNDNDLEG